MSGRVDETKKETLRNDAEEVLSAIWGAGGEISKAGRGKPNIEPQRFNERENQVISGDVRRICLMSLLAVSVLSPFCLVATSSVSCFHTVLGV